MQNKLTKGKLLDDKGRLVQSGYSTFLARTYDRKQIKASKWRIKEWDYYIVSNGEYSLALTMSDIGYLGLMSVSFIDLQKPSYKTTSKITLLPFGKYNFPSTYESGDLVFNSSDLTIKFLKKEQKRLLECRYINFDNGKELLARIELSDFPKDAMVIATPFDEDEKAFYYNAKINCMTAQGEVIIGDKSYVFDKKDSLATLDWGRGVWTYKNVWYWASMQQKLQSGDTIGFNLGYGFGNTEQASENMFFINGKAYKLDKVVFEINQVDGKDDFMSEWTIKDDRQKLFIRFKPTIDRYDSVNAIVVATCQHQVFGVFSGYILLDDGTVFEFKNANGFAEKVVNKW